MKKSALGKGLGALISDSSDSISTYNKYSTPAQATSNITAASICEISIEKIVANTMQPRTHFSEDALDDLAESIKSLGIIQPITVRPIGTKYQIISGERRYRAAIKVGLNTIPAYIKETDAKGVLEMAIVENIQREDLDAIEVALSYSRLIEECDLTQETMAERIGKKRSSITNYLRLLKLPISIQALLRDNKISMGHAKVLLSIENSSLQEKLCNEIIKKDLSVRQVEQIIKNTQKPKRINNDDKIELPETYYKVIDILGSYFDNNISLKRSNEGAGKLTISFKNDAQVESFLNSLKKLNN